MSGWAVFGIVLAVFVLIGCIPVGVDASYRENGLALRLKIGLFKLQVLPAKEKKKKPKPKAKKPAANKPDAKPEKPKKQGSMPKLTLSDILALADLACDTLGNLRRKLRVEVLVLHVTLDGSDPAKAAMLYGRVWAALGALTVCIILPGMDGGQGADEPKAQEQTATAALGFPRSTGCL